MKISGLAPGSEILNLEATIKEIGEVREFSKFGRAGKVATAVLEDETGEISMALWDEQVDEFRKGDRIRILGAYVKEWKGEKQLSLARGGSIEHI